MFLRKNTKSKDINVKLEKVRKNIEITKKVLYDVKN